MKTFLLTLSGLALATSSVSAVATASTAALGGFAVLRIKNEIFGIDGLNELGEDFFQVMAKTLEEPTGFTDDIVVITYEPMGDLADGNVDGVDDDEDDDDDDDDEEESESADATESSWSGGSCADVVCGDGMSDVPNKDSLMCTMTYEGEVELIVTPFSTSCRNCCIPDICWNYECPTEALAPKAEDDTIYMCSDYSCPAGMVPRENSENLICAQTQSNSADCVNCCVEPTPTEDYLCADFTCPEGFVSRTDGDYVCASSFYESESTCMNCCLVEDPVLCLC